MRQCSQQHALRDLQLKRFDQIFKGPAANCFDGCLQVTVGRDDDNRRTGKSAAKLAHGGEPVHTWQADVENQGVEWLA